MERENKRRNVDVQNKNDDDFNAPLNPFNDDEGMDDREFLLRRFGCGDFGIGDDDPLDIISKLPTLFPTINHHLNFFSSQVEEESFDECVDDQKPSTLYIDPPASKNLGEPGTGDCYFFGAVSRNFGADEVEDENDLRIVSPTLDEMIENKIPESKVVEKADDDEEDPITNRDYVTQDIRSFYTIHGLKNREELKEFFLKIQKLCRYPQVIATLYSKRLLLPHVSYTPLEAEFSDEFVLRVRMNEDQMVFDMSIFSLDTISAVAEECKFSWKMVIEQVNGKEAAQIIRYELLYGPVHDFSSDYLKSFWECETVNRSSFTDFGFPAYVASLPIGIPVIIERIFGNDKDVGVSKKRKTHSNTDFYPVIVSDGSNCKINYRMYSTSPIKLPDKDYNLLFYAMFEDDYDVRIEGSGQQVYLYPDEDWDIDLIKKRGLRLIFMKHWDRFSGKNKTFHDSYKFGRKNNFPSLEFFSAEHFIRKARLDDVLVYYVGESKKGDLSTNILKFAYIDTIFSGGSRDSSLIVSSIKNVNWHSLSTLCGLKEPGFTSFDNVEKGSRHYYVPNILHNASISINDWDAILSRPSLIVALKYFRMMCTTENERKLYTKNEGMSRLLYHGARYLMWGNLTPLGDNYHRRNVLLASIVAKIFCVRMAFYRQIFAFDRKLKAFLDSDFSEFSLLLEKFIHGRPKHKIFLNSMSDRYPKDDLAIWMKSPANAKNMISIVKEMEDDLEKSNSTLGELTCGDSAWSRKVVGLAFNHRCVGVSDHIFSALLSAYHQFKFK